jgi:translation initiation factor IF-1
MVRPGDVVNAGSVPSDSRKGGMTIRRTPTMEIEPAD